MPRNETLESLGWENDSFWDWRGLNIGAVPGVQVHSEQRGSYQSCIMAVQHLKCPMTMTMRFSMDYLRTGSKRNKSPI